MASARRAESGSDRKVRSERGRWGWGTSLSAAPSCARVLRVVHLERGEDALGHRQRVAPAHAPEDHRDGEDPRGILERRVEYQRLERLQRRRPHGHDGVDGRQHAGAPGRATPRQGSPSSGARWTPTIVTSSKHPRTRSRRKCASGRRGPHVHGEARGRLRLRGGGRRAWRGLGRRRPRRRRRLLHLLGDAAPAPRTSSAARSCGAMTSTAGRRRDRHAQVRPQRGAIDRVERAAARRLPRSSGDGHGRPVDERERRSPARRQRRCDLAQVVEGEADRGVAARPRAEQLHRLVEGRHARPRAARARGRRSSKASKIPPNTRSSARAGGRRSTGPLCAPLSSKCAAPPRRSWARSRSSIHCGGQGSASSPVGRGAGLAAEVVIWATLAPDGGAPRGRDQPRRVRPAARWPSRGPETRATPCSRPTGSTRTAGRPSTTSGKRASRTPSTQGTDEVPIPPFLEPFSRAMERAQSDDPRSSPSSGSPKPRARCAGGCDR